MSGSSREAPLARRSFLSRFGATLTATGAAWAAGSPAHAQSAANAPWQPSRHAQDDWLGQLPGRHRFVFDTTTPEGFSSALLYANNYFLANQAGYGLKDADLAVVIVARHNSTPFAYNDTIWAKYRATLAKSAERTTFPDLGNRLESLLKRGVHLAVCQMATRRIAGSIAGSAGINADRVYDELVANLVSNSHIVPAGIVAVNRAQEQGYSFAHAV